jgi:hypothetical protein
MGKPEVKNLMDMPLHVRSDILKFLWAEEYDAWEYNENDRVLIVDMHRLLAPALMRTKSKCLTFSPMFTLGWLTISSSMHA